MATALKADMGLLHVFYIVAPICEEDEGIRAWHKDCLALTEFVVVLFCGFLLLAFVPECCIIIDVGDVHKYLLFAPLFISVCLLGASMRILEMFV